MHTPATSDFEPTLEAAAARLQRINPVAYARSRNSLGGTVTGLSPYFTHGLLDFPAALATLQSQHPLGPQDKLVMEFGWREFFAHVWRHQGERIFSDQRPPITPLRYASTMPDDVLRACTSVPVIDQAVRTLYATGYLHNHARMWLASYLVHLRKVQWQVGADWLYAHLLDGDLASNHLSWQWVAGTFSVKPYLFNAENVARYAPAEWHSPGTVIDTSYEALDVMARESLDCGPEARQSISCEAPALHGAPPPQAFADWPAHWLAALPEQVHLVHPWSLGEQPAIGYKLGVIHMPFHARFAWSARRWAFVAGRMRECCDAVFVGDLHTLLPQVQTHQLSARDTANPGYAQALHSGPVQLESIPRFLEEPGRYCQSFSKFYGTQLHGKWHR
ncbi:MAG: FAD-binding domain-containing protein [Pseudomonadota bacterium]